MSQNPIFCRERCLTMDCKKELGILIVILEPDFAFYWLPVPSFEALSDQKMVSTSSAFAINEIHTLCSRLHSRDKALGICRRAMILRGTNYRWRYHSWLWNKKWRVFDCWLYFSGGFEQICTGQKRGSSDVFVWWGCEADTETGKERLSRAPPLNWCCVVRGR